MFISYFKLSLGITKTDKMKIGQTFTKTYTTHYGKKIIADITIVAIDGYNILFDNGAWYNVLELRKELQF